MVVGWDRHVNMKIRIEREWKLGARIDGGGFGEVYEASAVGCESAVAKLVPRVDGGQRELLFVDLGNARNTIPIIEHAETPEYYVLIMPRADKSLRQHIDEAGEPLGSGATVDILIDMVTTLVDLDGRVVHRDLKPENTLLYKNRWCLADFGIARYAEATTAPDTQKYALSPPYAAPERWREERATGAADVYALGVIAHELLSGSLPFSGAEHWNYRELHLHASPPHLDDVSSDLATLVRECLYKAPGARPSPSDVLGRLQRIGAPSVVGGLAELQLANQREIELRTELDLRESKRRSEREAREELFRTATDQLERMMEVLKSEIAAAAPASDFRLHPAGWELALGSATMEYSPARATEEEPWGNWESPAFSVVAHASLSIRIPRDSAGYEGRSHSLWFCDFANRGRFKWFEVAFMIPPIIQKRVPQTPFALEPGPEAARALGSGMAELQVAQDFTPIVEGELDEFIGRWASWLASGANGALSQS